MKTDRQLQQDVMEELRWDAAVQSAHIGVEARDGVVTLSGEIDSYAEKFAAADAAKRVAGVKGVAMDLEVKLPGSYKRTDADIAKAAVTALEWNVSVPIGAVQVKVDDGFVTLTGEVDWGYQSASAEQALQPLVGVRGVTNQIRIAQRVNSQQIHSDISAALTRHAQREASHIGVEVEGGTVTLSGQVGSLAERDAAMGTAFAAKGVMQVVDRLEVIG